MHPGETNASFIMAGVLGYLAGPEAAELRKRVVFKVVPCTNPDGVVVGNYRASLSGNDLNRQFLAPNPKLHPTVCALKALVAEVLASATEPEPLAAFLDVHGHSRKKSVFVYGPHFPLHSERYLKMRVLPQLLSERTDMFRFYSCKFRIQKSKLKAARVVLFKEFGIMNCFTLEASFHGYLNRDRATVELTAGMFREVGRTTCEALLEYLTLVEEDDRQKALLRAQFRKRKKARDIAKACLRRQEPKPQEPEEPKPKPEPPKAEAGKRTLKEVY